MRRGICFIVPILWVATIGPPSGAASASDSFAACPPATLQSGALDYRQRNASDFNKWRLQDNNRYHLAPALEGLRKGELSRAVRADIEFLLGAWPNHYAGLEALVRYDLAGGRTYDGLSTECLFLRARNFAVGDITVLLAEAYYHWKMDRKDRALDSYRGALEIDSESADANYYIGLLYFELGDYELSERHARVAYQQGYQLPGLKNKLLSVGRWSKGSGPVAE